MKAIQSYFSKEGRNLTDVEFETIAQTWSEHCVHKTFKARVEVDRYTGTTGKSRNIEIDSLIKTYLEIRHR